MPSTHFNSFSEEIVSPVTVANALPATQSANNSSPTQAVLSSLQIDFINTHALIYIRHLIDDLGYDDSCQNDGNILVCASLFGFDTKLEINNVTGKWVDSATND